MIILDTHVLLWFISDFDKLSKKAAQKINSEIKEGAVFVSSISIWEICLLIKKDRLKLKMDFDVWLMEVESLPFVQFVSVDNQIAAKSVNLPGNFHSDPADRIIVATARKLGLTVITADEKIRKYPHTQALW